MCDYNVLIEIQIMEAEDAMEINISMPSKNNKRAVRRKRTEAKQNARLAEASAMDEYFKNLNKTDEGLGLNFIAGHKGLCKKKHSELTEYDKAVLKGKECHDVRQKGIAKNESPLRDNYSSKRLYDSLATDRIEAKAKQALADFIDQPCDDNFLFDSLYDDIDEMDYYYFW